MTLRKDAVSKVYSADVRDGPSGRVHLSLRTTRKDEAELRQSALRALLRDGDAALIADVRQRRITIEAVTRLYLARRPFAELRGSTTWPNLGQAAEEYVAWLEAHPDRARQTATAARSYLKKALAFFGPDLPLAAITADRTAEFRASLTERTPPLSAWSVGLHLSRLAALYAWVQKRETRRALEERRPAATLYTPVDREMIARRPKPRKRFLSEAEARQLMAATPESLAAGVGLGLMAGLRAGEVVTLAPRDVDLALGLVMVRPKDAIAWRPKSDAGEREIPIADALRSLLERHLARYASAHWLFPSPVLEDAPITTVYLTEQMQRIVPAAELVYGRGEPDAVTFHTLRHTFASWLVMEGVDLFTVSRLMGHASTKQVEETYAHLAPEHRRAAVSRLNRQFALCVAESPPKPHQE